MPNRTPRGVYYLHSVVYDACQNQVRAGASAGDAAEHGVCKEVRSLEGGILCRLEGRAGGAGEEGLPELVADLGEREEGAFFCGKRAPDCAGGGKRGWGGRNGGLDKGGRGGGKGQKGEWRMETKWSAGTIAKQSKLPRSHSHLHSQKLLTAIPMPNIKQHDALRSHLERAWGQPPPTYCKLRTYPQQGAWQRAPACRQQ